MSPQEALELLNQVAASFQTDRQTHSRLQAAVSVLQAEINKLEAAPEE